MSNAQRPPLITGYLHGKPGASLWEADSIKVILPDRREVAVNEFAIDTDEPEVHVESFELNGGPEDGNRFVILSSGGVMIRPRDLVIDRHGTSAHYRLSGRHEDGTALYRLVSITKTKGGGK